jgi:uncharacterized damage-inducible protein DinB
MKFVDPIIKELEAESKTTLRVLERVPEAKLAWKPHEKSSSLGQLAHHVASIPGNIASMAIDDHFEVGSFGKPPEPKTSAEILEAHRHSVQKAKDLMSQVDDERAMATWSLKREGKAIITIPRVALYRNILLNHWIHHRGQLTVYLRLLDIPVPSVYGPSADENPFASS